MRNHVPTPGTVVPCRRRMPPRWLYANIHRGSALVAARKSRITAGRVARNDRGLWEAWAEGVCLGRQFLTRRSAAQVIYECVILPQGLDGWKVAA